MSASRSNELHAAVFMTAAAVLSAAMAIMVYVATQRGHWTWVVTGRLGLGIVIAALFARLVGVRIWQAPEPWGWVRTAAGALGVPAAFYALATLPPADAVTLMNTGPLWAVMFQSLLKRRLPPIYSIVAACIAAVGVVLLKRPEFAGLGLAAGLALLNGVCRGVAIVSVGRISSTPASIQVVHASAGALVTTMLLLPFIGGAGDLHIDGLWLFLGLVVGVALLATVANMAASRALRIGSTHKIAPLLYLSPAAALIGELVFLNHSTSARHVLGLSLIIGPALWLTIVSARTRLELVERSPIGEIDPATFEPKATEFIAATENSALVEVRVHVERGDVTPLDRARQLFYDNDLGNASLGHGLLVAMFPDQNAVVLIGDHFLEQRLDERQIRQAIQRATTVDALLAGFRDELSRKLVTQGRRDNEISDEVTFHGY